MKISPRWAKGNDFGDEIAQELFYDFIALQHQVTQLIPQLLPEQSHVFHQVLSKIESGNGRSVGIIGIRGMITLSPHLLK